MAKPSLANIHFLRRFHVLERKQQREPESSRRLLASTPASWVVDCFNIVSGDNEKPER
jgi:hypothetical protein